MSRYWFRLLHVHIKNNKFSTFYFHNLLKRYKTRLQLSNCSGGGQQKTDVTLHADHLVSTLMKKQHTVIHMSQLLGG